MVTNLQGLLTRHWHLAPGKFTALHLSVPITPRPMVRAMPEVTEACHALACKKEPGLVTSMRCIFSMRWQPARHEKGIRNTKLRRSMSIYSPPPPPRPFVEIQPPVHQKDILKNTPKSKPRDPDLGNPSTTAPAPGSASPNPPARPPHRRSRGGWPPGV